MLFLSWIKYICKTRESFPAEAKDSLTQIYGGIWGSSGDPGYAGVTLGWYVVLTLELEEYFRVEDGETRVTGGGRRWLATPLDK